MLKWLKFNPKFFLYTLLVLTCLFTVSVLAQSTNLLKQKQDAISQGGNQEAWLSEAFSSNAVAGLQALVGPIPNDVIDGKKTSWIPGGALGSVNQAIAYTFTPAASGVEYIAQTWNNFLGKPAYAQANTGFAGLQPILPIWRGFRNVVYILASLVFIIIGIMIMLRVKISPQSVITVQNAIPQLITTLILVTFSYAIAGLLIDLMNFVQGTVLYTIFSANNKQLTDNLLTPNLLAKSDYSTLNNMNLFTIFAIATKNIGLWVITAIGAIVGGILVAFAVPLPIFMPLTIPGGAGIGAILFTLIAVIIIFINLLRFFFGLLKVYVNIILKIVLAPLEIGLGAFPGSKQGFSSWIIELIGNLAVFPASIFFIVLVNLISEFSNGNQLYAPSIVDNGNFIGFIIAFGGLMILPKIPELVPQAIFGLKPNALQQAANFDFSKNAIVRTAKSTAYNYAGGQVALGAAGRGVFGGVGGVIESVGGLEAAQATGAGIQNTGKS